jgi:KaiC/GvpD/RAD55 family RecA-like ATPase/DNA-binding XRE family transcriptional regulator
MGRFSLEHKRKGPPMTNIGARIKAVRNANHLTQLDLAELADINQGDLSRYEAGVISPGLRVVQRIMAAMYEHFDPTADWAGDSTALTALDPLGPMEPVDWLVEDFLARGTITMIAGEAGAGKSAMTQHLAVTMANAAAEGLDEDDCAGLTVRAGKVLIIDAENGANLVRGRLQAAGLTEAGAKHCQVRLADDFDISTGLAQCRALLAAEQPDMLVLDSLSSLWSGSISSVAAVKKLIRSLRSLATEYGCGILLISHTVKTGKSYRGSGVLGQSIDGGIFLWRKVDGSGLRVLACEKMRMAPEAGPRLFMLTGFGLMSSVMVGSTASPEI